MRRHSFAALLRLFAALPFLLTLVTALPAGADAPPRPPHPGHAERVCSEPRVASQPLCEAWRRTDVAGLSAALVNGFAPADLQGAYALTSASASFGAGLTVAVVDAYDDPNAERDLGTYRSQFGMAKCTTRNGCFQKVNEHGVRGSYPPANSGWAQEISLDLDMVSAICPNCKIVLVEANPNCTDMYTGVNTAASKGAVAISNSWTCGEYAGEATDSATYFNHPNVAITAASGDGGYGVAFPAASQYVTAVGGTSLVRDGSTTRGWSETVWGGAGSGCSAYIARPAYQSGSPWSADTTCANRTVTDVAADADPNTGVAVYDSYFSPGWMVFGGTSVASPIVASVYALADAQYGNAGNNPATPYTHTANLNDVTSGTNGACTDAYLCTAGTGYDGPTGNGTPNGTGAF